ncbi:hypothetical protein Ccrd_013670, partial [Cynara cardunculus var. scolymus]
MHSKQETMKQLFDKYEKRKKLEPLEAYVPAIILTEMQITELGKTLEANQPQYVACWSLLHAGPTSSLRMNIRAICYLGFKAFGVGGSNIGGGSPKSSSSPPFFSIVDLIL